MSQFSLNSKKILPHKKLNPKYNRFDLSQEEIDELKSAFQVFEEDDTGRINPKSIIKIFQSLGFDKDNQNIVNMLEYLQGVANNELISFEQFLEGSEKFLGRNTPEVDLKKIYEMFIDSNENPVITYDSFKRMLSNLGEEMTEEESAFIFEKNSGEKKYIDFNDFKIIFKRNSIHI